MSEVRDNNDNREVPVPEVPNEDQQLVKRDVYKRVSEDMLKYKQEKKELAAELERIKADLEVRETQTLKEQEKFKELWQKSQSEVEKLRSERAKEHLQFVEFHKKNAVIQNIGGFKKDVYSKFIDVQSIEVLEDGSIDQDSVSLEVERLKREFPEILKTTSKTALPDSAPKGPIQKDWKDMSSEERAAAKRNLLKT